MDSYSSFLQKWGEIICFSAIEAISSRDLNLFIGDLLFLVSRQKAPSAFFFLISSPAMEMQIANVSDTFSDPNFYTLQQRIFEHTRRYFCLNWLLL